MADDAPIQILDINLKISKNVAKDDSFQFSGLVGNRGFVVAREMEISENESSGKATQINANMSKKTLEDIQKNQAAGKNSTGKDDCERTK